KKRAQKRKERRARRRARRRAERRAERRRAEEREEQRRKEERAAAERSPDEADSDSSDDDAAGGAEVGAGAAFSAAGTDGDSDGDSGGDSGADLHRAAEPGAAASASSPPGTGALSLVVGPEMVGRRFGYRDDLFRELRGYELAGAASLGAGAEWYPLAERGGHLARLGVAARLIVTPGFRSTDAEGRDYTSRAHHVTIGARYAVALGRLRLAAALGGGHQVFKTAPDDPEMESVLPGVSYRFVRAGLHAAAPLTGRYGLKGAIGYRHILSSGEIADADHFPRMSGMGIDLDLALVARLTAGLDLRLGGAL